MIKFKTKSGSEYEYEPVAGSEPCVGRIRRLTEERAHRDRLSDGEWHAARVDFSSEYGAHITYADGGVAFTSRILHLSAE